MSDFKTMGEVVERFFGNPVFKNQVYCDYIAHLISKELKANDNERLLASVGRPMLDLDAEGAFVSTKKSILVEDRFGRKYVITVEEA